MSSVNLDGSISASIHPGDIRFEGYSVDRERWQISHLGIPIPLKHKTFSLLLHLIDHRDQLVTKDAMMKALWDGLVVEESNVTQHIFLLRKALSRHESGVKIIETVAGRGYRFIARVDEPPAAPALLAAAPRTPPPLRLRAALAAGCVLFTLAGYGLRYWQESADLPRRQVIAALPAAGSSRGEAMR